MAAQRKSHGKYRLDQVKNNKLLGLDRTSSDIAVSSLSLQTKVEEACHTCTLTLTAWHRKHESHNFLACGNMKLALDVASFTYCPIVFYLQYDFLSFCT